MAESTEPFSAWIGQKVHLEYEAGDRTADASGTLEEVNDRGVFISEGETTYFYPWRNVVRIGSGHKPPRGRGTVRARE
jgi:ribosome maturation factor RimP